MTRQLLLSFAPLKIGYESVRPMLGTSRTGQSGLTMAVSISVEIEQKFFGWTKIVLLLLLSHCSLEA